MAHALDMSNGRANFAYVGEPGWHGLGSELPAGADLETWRKVAGLEWEALEAESLYRFGDELRAHDGRKTLVRSDTGDALANVGEGYRVVQPAAVLEFYRDLCDASGMFTLETAGSLHSGRKIWAMAKSKMELRIGTADIVLPYLFLATSFDGSMATTGKFTTTRVVCQNTLAMADGGAGAAVRIPHSTHFEADRVKADLGLVEDRAHEFETTANELAEIRIGRDDALEFFGEIYGRDTPSLVWPLDELDLETLSKPRQRRIELATAAFEEAPGAELKGAKGTLWGAVNAVTFLADHEGTGRTPESRFASAQFGHGAATKAAAWTLAGDLLAAIKADRVAA